MNPITFTLQEPKAASSGAEIAPQKSRRFGPEFQEFASRSHDIGSGQLPFLSAAALCSFDSSTSRRFPAESNTGETRSCQCGMAIFHNKPLKQSPRQGAERWSLGRHLKFLHFPLAPVGERGRWLGVVPT